MKALKTLIITSFFTGLFAHERMWTYVYDTDPVPKGLVEFEPWITFKYGREGYKKYFKWEFRWEFEYAFTPHFTFALYINQKREYKVTDTDIYDKFKFSTISLEFFYRVWSPTEKPVGLALYFEPVFGGHEIEFEEKLIISKWFGEKINTALNIVLEQEMEDKWEIENGETELHKEKEAILMITGGIAYKVNPFTPLGLEFFTHSEWNDVLFPSGNTEHTAFFIGPNIHLSFAKYWITFSFLPQVTNFLNEHERFEARTIMGLIF
jgi:hypothetical protein